MSKVEVAAARLRAAALRGDAEAVKEALGAGLAEVSAKGRAGVWRAALNLELGS